MWLIVDKIWSLKLLQQRDRKALDAARISFTCAAIPYLFAMRRGKNFSSLHPSAWHISLLMIETFLQALSQSLKGLSISTRCVRRWGMRGSLLIRRQSKFLPHNVPVLSIDIPISREHSLLSSSANFVQEGKAVKEWLAVSGRNKKVAHSQLFCRTLRLRMLYAMFSFVHSEARVRSTY